MGALPGIRLAERRRCGTAAVCKGNSMDFVTIIIPLLLIILVVQLGIIAVKLDSIIAALKSRS